MGEHVYLESDGKLLLVYDDGTGPAIPVSYTHLTLPTTPYV